jgi:hypothetical protein
MTERRDWAAARRRAESRVRQFVPYGRRCSRCTARPTSWFTSR